MKLKHVQEKVDQIKNYSRKAQPAELIKSKSRESRRSLVEKLIKEIETLQMDGKWVSYAKKQPQPR